MVKSPRQWAVSGLAGVTARGCHQCCPACVCRAHHRGSPVRKESGSGVSCPTGGPLWPVPHPLPIPEQGEAPERGALLLRAWCPASMSPLAPKVLLRQFTPGGANRFQLTLGP